MGSNYRREQLTSFLLEFLEKHVDEDPEWKPVVPASRSLNSCEGDQSGDRIEFSFDHAFSLNTFTDSEPGDALQSRPIPMNHGHLLWSYATNLKRVETDSYEFSLVSLGPHLNRELMKRRDPDYNVPEELKEPRIEASISILGEKKDEVMKLILPHSLVLPQRFSMLQLIGLSVNKQILVRIRIVIDRSYFSLANVIDLDELPPTVSRERQSIVDDIGRGARLGDDVWQITVPGEQNGQGDAASPRHYYIHKGAAAYAFRAIKEGELPGADCCINDLIIRNDSREISPVTTVDMKVIIPLIYCGIVPLPERSHHLIGLVCSLIDLIDKDVLLLVLFPQWERAICKAALAIDTSNLAALPTIARLVAIIWSCPYGVMSVAKRVAVGVMADVLHRNSNGRVAGLPALLCSDEVSRALSGRNLARQAVILHLHAVVMVRKTFLAAGKPSAAAVAARIPAAAPVSAAAAATPVAASAAAPTAAESILDVSVEVAASGAVVIDVPDEEEEEEWYDTETIEDKKEEEEASQWGCVIS